MKKYIIALFVFFSATCFAQVPNAIIDSIRPDIICFNQPAKFYAHFTGSWSGTNNAPIRDSLSAFNRNITYQQWIDSNYVVTLTIISGGLTVGTHKMYIPSFGNSAAVNLTVNNCTFGIEHYNSKEDLLSTQYYNLLGQPVKEPDGICIEVKTYMGGQREVRKIVTNK
jgi:hypothetical protein